MFLKLPELLNYERKFRQLNLYRDTKLQKEIEKICTLTKKIVILHSQSGDETP